MTCSPSKYLNIHNECILWNTWKQKSVGTQLLRINLTCAWASIIWSRLLSFHSYRSFFKFIWEFLENEITINPCRSLHTVKINVWKAKLKHLERIQCKLLHIICQNAHGKSWQMLFSESKAARCEQHTESQITESKPHGFYHSTGVEQQKASLQWVSSSC